MALNLQSYQIQKTNERTYSFITEKSIEYRCIFISYAEYFPNHPDIAPNIFSFNLELKDPKTKLPKGSDKRIADTVISVVGDFLASKTNAVVYVCDNSDGKEAVRARKFLSWFNYIDYPEIIQINNNFKVGGLFIYSAMLIHHKNKHKKEFALAYLELTEGDEK
jgi:Family of unknown function (DUF6169)